MGYFWKYRQPGIFLCDVQHLFLSLVSDVRFWLNEVFSPTFFYREQMELGV